MSYKYHSIAWETPDLSPSEKLVLISLADQANDEGQSWYSYASMSKRTGVHRTTVINAIKKFAKMQIITISQRARTDGGNAANLITFCCADEKKNGGSSDGPPEGVVVDNPPSSERLPGGVVRDYPPSSERLPHESTIESTCLTLTPPTPPQKGEGKDEYCEENTEYSFDTANGEKFTLTQKNFSSYQKTYQSTDVPRELRKAARWCADNSSKRKTRQGMPRFINAWLSRADSDAQAHRGGGKRRSDRDDAYENYWRGEQ